MLSFTGYLLPWDQIAYWAITIGTNMASYAPLFNTPGQAHPAGRPGGGPEHAAAVLRAAHHGASRSSAAIFLAVHFWRIRKDGGISGPL